MRTRSRLAGAFIAGAVIAGVAVGGVAVAQTGGTGEITACLQGNSFKVPDANGECNGNAEAITWNVEGPEGPAGPPGPDGPPGSGASVAVVSVEVTDNTPAGDGGVADYNFFLNLGRFNSNFRCSESEAGGGYCNIVMPLGLDLELGGFGPGDDGGPNPIPATWGLSAVKLGV